MKITLKDNIEVTIKELHQWETYNGLLEGLPTDRTNKLTIERVIQRAKEICHMEEYYMLEPDQTPIEYDRDRPYPFGKPMSLPSRVCIAELWHHQPARDQEMHASALLLIWFQDEYCFPIAPEILEKFKNVEWKQHALDFDY